MSSVSSLGHLLQASPVKVSSVSGWVLPYPSSYQGLALFPAPFRVTAFASLTSSPPLGIRRSLRSAYRGKRPFSLGPSGG
ncbi:hypothetical protein [Leptolyngbya sp. Heron Island J]|uniref:hypothetical protein n=1 Tax=Leptolyngbya sp. Heron Island J TaxID=1385935 RepID=UPI001268FC1C|nr:hypothetical protein [Leptolyngbya sp. Heron Island J]